MHASCRIRHNQSQVFFDSLYSLITHYQQRPLVSPKFSITLGRAVPPPNQHEGKPWFHPSIKREQAEDMLSHVRKEGAFLVRMGERILGSFAITFRAENKVGGSDPDRTHSLHR